MSPTLADARPDDTRTFTGILNGVRADFTDFTDDTPVWLIAMDEVDADKAGEVDADGCANFRFDPNRFDPRDLARLIGHACRLTVSPDRDPTGEWEQLVAIRDEEPGEGQ